MSDFTPRDGKMPDVNDMGTWTPRLLMCINKSGYTLSRIRKVIQRFKQDPSAPNFDRYHCKWCGQWHLNEIHDPQYLKKRRKCRLKELHERWKRRNQPR